MNYFEKEKAERTAWIETHAEEFKEIQEEARQNAHDTASKEAVSSFEAGIDVLDPDCELYDAQGMVFEAGVTAADVYADEFAKQYESELETLVDEAREEEEAEIGSEE